MKAKSIFQRMTIVLFLAGISIPVPVRAAEIPAQVRVTLTILEVQEIDDIDGFAADFYAKVLIGNHGWWKTPYINDQMRAAPHWTFSAVTDANAIVPIKIELWDYDSPDSDDKADISPVSGRRVLRLRYNAATGATSGDILDFDSRDITVRGRGDSDRAQIKLSITQSPAPPPPAQGVGNTPSTPTCEDPKPSGSDSGGPYESSAAGLHSLPSIYSVTPNPVRAGAVLVVSGIGFGDPPSERGSQKQMVVMSVENSPRLIPLEVLQANWTHDEIRVQVPLFLSGEYKIGIFCSSVPGSRIMVSLASNWASLTIH